MRYSTDMGFFPTGTETGPVSGFPNRREFDRAAYRFFKEFNGYPPGIGLHEFLTRFERAIVFNALAEMDGCQRRAARFLKLKSTTLNRKVKVQQIHFVKTPV
jgi:DNA-binding NtrC family response regulator